MNRWANDLVAWFTAHGRDLPWRKSRDPYAVWISEIMLQQTRIETVVGYFGRWMAAFPTVTALNQAPLDEVLAHSAGLGYYSRARNLHGSARMIVEQHGGQFPRDLTALLALPGIGRYTAGAIASIAFGQPTSIVDGNVARVLQRLYAIPGTVQDRVVNAELWKLAAQLVPAGAASRFNQGLMELGQVVCTVSDPDCAHCPLSKPCQARKQRRQHELPAPRKKRAVPVVRITTVVVQDRRGMLLMRRKPRGLWGGLWEPPCFEVTTRSSPLKATAELCRALGVTAGNQAPIRFEHLLTHRRVRFSVYRAVAGRKATPHHRLPQYDGAKWVQPSDLGNLGVAAWTTRLLTALCKETDV